jgi:polysaccharide export outer membrane protein
MCNFPCLVVLLAPLLGPDAIQGVPSAQAARGTEQENRRLAQYVLGADDVITLQVRDSEEMSEKPYRIDGDGMIRLPLIGGIQCAGLTIEELEAVLRERLREWVIEPEVVVLVKEFRSQPVSVVGAVNNPGVLQVQGRKNLLEILSMAGGVRQDASSKLKITRRREAGPLPLPGAAPDQTAQFTVAEIDFSDLMAAKNPAQNIAIRPHDVITVPKADLIYVLGEVRKPGGFVIRDEERISVLTALSLAEGTLPTASQSHARILRSQPGAAARLEIPVNLQKIVRGKGEDMLLRADDILVVPDSAAKKIALRTVEAAVTVTSGLIIWRR